MRRNTEIYRVTLCGGAVNLLLLLFRFVAGIVGHSVAYKTMNIVINKNAVPADIRGKLGI